MAMDVKSSSVLFLLLKGPLNFLTNERFQLVIHVIDEVSNPKKTMSTILGNNIGFTDLCNNLAG
ncbi:MAG: hypothetical protein ACI9DJ_000145 [Algoriphagus sp.]|jgi:hypothetical protein